MNKTILVFAVPFTVLVIGVPGYVYYAKNVKPITDAQDAVKQELIDPNSAEFRNVSAVGTGDVCGEVNSKNRMGGYVGFRYFKVSTFGGKRSVLLDSDTLAIAQQLCKGK